jgi:hypothetical protein
VFLYWTPGHLQNPRPTVFPRTDFEYFRESPEAFAAVTGHWIRPARLTVGEMTESISGELVTANYFDVLGVKPIVGRTFAPEEDKPGSLGLAVVISHDLWVRRFQGNHDAVGKTVRLAHDVSNPREATVIGVMPAGFVGVSNPWTPSQYWITFAQGSGSDYRRFAVAPIARLKPGVTTRHAQVIVTTQGQQLNRDRRGREQDSYLVMSARKVRMPFDPYAKAAPARLTVSLGLVVVMVLVATIANVTGLMRARAIGRSSEIFVRRALGATGMNVGRQLIVEGVLLASAAGALGIIIASWLIELFRHYTPNRFAVPLSVDMRVWTFAVLLCLAIGVIISLGPALQGIRAELVDPTRVTVQGICCRRSSDATTCPRR